MERHREGAERRHTLEDQDRETLRAFAKVEPPPSRNPALHERFRDAKERIRQRLSEMDTEGEAVRVNPSGGLGPWFVQVNRLIREIRQKVLDAQKTKAKTAIASIKKYLQADYDALCEQWPDIAVREPARRGFAGSGADAAEAN